MIGKYNVGEVWWTYFPYQEQNVEKHRPAIVIDEDTIAILAMYVTSQNKDCAYSVLIEDWQKTGLKKPSWARIDRIIQLNEQNMDRKIGDLSDKDLKKIVELVTEITKDIYHEFLLVTITNSLKGYLLRYDERWKCWLFPYIRGAAANKENVDRYVTELCQQEIETQYMTTEVHCKYSVSDQCYKRYRHKLYRMPLEKLPAHMEKDSFVVNGEMYCWMTIDEMEKNDGIMTKNSEVIAFVKNSC